jgi:GDPmannose 4,6-dehydratase
MRIALITGVTGQDGHHLAPFLLQKGYEVHGIINGQRNSREASFKALYPEVVLHQGDLTDFGSLINILGKVSPSEVYNLGAISYVGFRQLGLADQIRFYQASSSEMFGKVKEIPQTETTPFHPRSPYGVAKTFAHFTCINYREAYNMHASAGILFNHEGEFRGHEFVTRKITSNVAKIALGKQKRFSLGDLSPVRDWGYAGDYVQAMWLMLQQDFPEDYVIATGETHSVKEFLELALEISGLPVDIEKYVDFNPSMTRPAEVELLVGDAQKAKDKLGWEATVRFKELVRLMVENDLRIEHSS